jgi:hypothetical protein
MNLALDYLSSKLPIHGLAAYSMRSSGAPVANQCFSKSLYANTAEEMLGRVMQEGQTLFSSQGTAANFCWTFEAHQVYIAARADGVSLGLLVENNAGIQISRIRDLLQGFLEMEVL